MVRILPFVVVMSFLGCRPRPIAPVDVDESSEVVSRENGAKYALATDSEMSKLSCEVVEIPQSLNWNMTFGCTVSDKGQGLLALYKRYQGSIRGSLQGRGHTVPLELLQGFGFYTWGLKGELGGILEAVGVKSKLVIEHENPQLGLPVFSVHLGRTSILRTLRRELQGLGVSISGGSLLADFLLGDNPDRSLAGDASCSPYMGLIYEAPMARTMKIRVRLTDIMRDEKAIISVISDDVCGVDQGFEVELIPLGGGASQLYRGTDLAARFDVYEGDFSLVFRVRAVDANLDDVFFSGVTIQADNATIVVEDPLFQ